MVNCFQFCFNFAFKFNLRRYSAAPGGMSMSATRQEVHRFLLTDEHGQPISSVRDRKVICNKVLSVLLQ